MSICLTSLVLWNASWLIRTECLGLLRIAATPPFTGHWQGLSPYSDTSQPSQLWLLWVFRKLPPKVSTETTGLNPGPRLTVADFAGDRNPINKLHIQKQSLSSGNGARCWWQRQMCFVCPLNVGFALYLQLPSHIVTASLFPFSSSVIWIHTVRGSL